MNSEDFWAKGRQGRLELRAGEVGLTPLVDAPSMSSGLAMRKPKSRADRFAYSDSLKGHQVALFL